MRWPKGLWPGADGGIEGAAEGIEALSAMFEAFAWPTPLSAMCFEDIMRTWSALYGTFGTALLWLEADPRTRSSKPRLTLPLRESPVLQGGEDVNALQWAYVEALHDGRIATARQLAPIAIAACDT